MKSNICIRKTMKTATTIMGFDFYVKPVKPPTPKCPRDLINKDE